MVTAAAVSCVHTAEPVARNPDVEEVPRTDTVVTRLKIVNGSDWCGIEKLDILLYEAAGLQDLELHEQMDSCGMASLQSTAGKKECIVVANSTKDLSLKIMGRLDTANSLRFSYEDEDCRRPVMVGRASLTAGEDTEITLTPFLCRIMIEEVSNAMDGWVLMEEPKVYLSDINPDVGLLQEKDFRPSATREEGPSASLPCDIGFYSQYPGTILHLYPNDTPERVLGGLRSHLTFSCKVEGELVEQTEALPPAGRGALIKAKVTMSDQKQLTISF